MHSCTQRWLRSRLNGFVAGRAACTEDFDILDSFSKLGIQNGRATWNFSQRMPHVELKGRACRLHRQAFDRVELSFKIPADRIRQTIWVAGRSEAEPALAVVETQEPAYTFFVVGTAFF